MTLYRCTPNILQQRKLELPALFISKAPTELSSLQSCDFAQDVK